MADSDVVVIIPARMAATRLPGKPLADIGGEPMIVHVLRRATEAGVGPVVVATDSRDIAAAVERAGGRAVMTRADHPSGSDRLFEALGQIDPARRIQFVVNVQGDLPTLAPGDIRAALALLADPAVAVGTLAAQLRKGEDSNPNVVKVFASGRGASPTGSRLRACDFSRTYPEGREAYHHIGLYAYRRDVLAAFVALPQSPRERDEKLEQLRLVEDGRRIDAAIVDSVPLGVDTPEDLETARRLLAKRG
jgi:3-deoxy-manno-octulosonate cytidylyltransferase (CMP-KDO synthetase)